MKHFTLKLFLLIACLCGSTSVWAQTTTLYERGTTNAWKESDLADWTAVTATSTVINGGIFQNGTNAGYNVSKALTVKENSVVTLTASLVAGGAPGRNSSYDYIRIGGIELRLNGQDQNAKIFKDGTEVATLSGFSRNGNYNVTFVVNQASGEITYEVSGGTSGTGKVTSTTAVTNVVVGHNRGGRENYETSVTLKSIKIEEKVQTVAAADYTINYVYGGETIKTVNESSVVGVEVFAENPVTINEVKYYAQAGEATSLVLVNGENVLNVKLRLADNYNYTVNATDGENVLNTISTGTVVEGESAYVYYPQFILNGATLREIANNASGDYYGTAVTPDADNYVQNLAYVKSTVEDVVFYVEGEKIEGASTANGTARASNGQMGYAPEGVTLTTLEPGVYKFYVRGVNSNNDARAYSFNNGEKALFAAEISGRNTNYLANSEEVTIEETSEIIFTCAGSSQSGMDWIYIQRTGDVEPETVEITPVADMITFCSPENLDFTNVEGLKAYIITDTDISDNDLELTEVNVVPAGTGVLLEGTKGTTYKVPVVVDEPDLNKGNILVAAEEDVALADGEAYILTAEGKFNLCNAGTLAMGKAYIPASSFGGSVKELSLSFAGATAINGIENAKTADNAIFNLAGQRVAQPTKGIYIVNGKKVFVK